MLAKGDENVAGFEVGLGCDRVRFDLFDLQAGGEVSQEILVDVLTGYRCELQAELAGKVGAALVIKPLRELLRFGFKLFRLGLELLAFGSQFGQLGLHLL